MFIFITRLAKESTIYLLSRKHTWAFMTKDISDVGIVLGMLGRETGHTVGRPFDLIRRKVLLIVTERFNHVEKQSSTSLMFIH
jgi:hypothetical protein